MCIDEIRVGIAEYQASHSPSKIITIGLGSCVGITLYDPSEKIGGLAHIMLPDSRQFSTVSNPGKFPDLAIPLLLERMMAMGAKRNGIYAKIGGGASMFNFNDKSLIMDIGNRNVLSVKETLRKLSIPLRGEETGGNQGRTMVLDIGAGKTYIKTVSKGIREI
jgi:Chemotaxis protein; stimulates methylation of MCP proteins